MKSRQDLGKRLENWDEPVHEATGHSRGVPMRLITFSELLPAVSVSCISKKLLRAVLTTPTIASTVLRREVRACGSCPRKISCCRELT